MTNEDKIRELLIKAEALESEVDFQLKGLKSMPFIKQEANLSSKLRTLRNVLELTLERYKYLKEEA